MALKKRRTTIYVDAENLILDHFSGIGHYTAELLLAVDDILSKEGSASVSLVAYYKKIHRLGRFAFRNFRFRRYPFPTGLSNRLKIKGIHPPVDLMYGKKVFLYPNYSSWPMLFSPSIPFIYDLSYILHPEFVSGPNQQFLIQQVPLSISRATKVLTISENSKKEIVEHFNVDPDDIFVCYPAADNKLFYRRSQEEIEKTKAKYGILDDYIMFLGNLEPRKNLKGLLLAYQHLPKALRKKYALLLVGAKGWNDDEIHELILKMRMNGDRIIQPVDYVMDEDRPALYSGAAAFAYVSLYEGFGIPPLEAMACGTPVISSDNSSLPEAVGDAAVMVDAHDVQSIAKGLEKVLTDNKLAAELIKRGYKQADKFSYATSAKILLEQIRGLT